MPGYNHLPSECLSNEDDTSYLTARSNVCDTLFMTVSNINDGNPWPRAPYPSTVPLQMGKVDMIEVPPNLGSLPRICSQPSGFYLGVEPSLGLPPGCSISEPTDLMASDETSEPEIAVQGIDSILARIPQSMDEDDRLAAVGSCDDQCADFSVSLTIDGCPALTHEVPVVYNSSCK